MKATIPIRPAVLLLLYLVAALFLPSSAQSCTSFTFSNSRAYRLCSSLAPLSSSLHWNYNAAAGTVDLAYRATQGDNGWAAWAINPTGSGMVGAQALVAFRNTTTGTVGAYTTSVASTSPSMQPGQISFQATRVGAEYSNGVMTIFATVALLGNRTRVNHVWQESTTFTPAGFPGAHTFGGDNIRSVASLDFLSGEASSSGNSRNRRKNTHGVLNAVSWGVLMPVGAIVARYLRVFKSADPAWFYLHIACQCSAYILGVAGWGTGLKLGSESVGVKYSSHRNIGISLFCMATLQVFALLLRPNKDNKYRIYWNVYHHSVGYSVIILSIVNIFKGFDILDPSKKWKHAYIGVISTLAAVALILEVVTWAIVLKRRRSRSSEDKSHHGVNGGAAATNGYGARQHQVV